MPSLSRGPCARDLSVVSDKDGDGERKGSQPGERCAPACEPLLAESAPWTPVRDHLKQRGLDGVDEAPSASGSEPRLAGLRDLSDTPSTNCTATESDASRSAEFLSIPSESCPRKGAPRDVETDHREAPLTQIETGRRVDETLVSSVESNQVRSSELRAAQVKKVWSNVVYLSATSSICVASAMTFERDSLASYLFLLGGALFVVKSGYEFSRSLGVLRRLSLTGSQDARRASPEPLPSQRAAQRVWSNVAFVSATSSICAASSLTFSSDFVPSYFFLSGGLLFVLKAVYEFVRSFSELRMLTTSASSQPAATIPDDHAPCQRGAQLGKVCSNVVYLCATTSICVGSTMLFDADSLSSYFYLVGGLLFVSKSVYELFRSIGELQECSIGG